MSQQHRPQPASTIQRESSQSTAALPAPLTPHLPPNTNTSTTSTLALDNVTPGPLPGICGSNNARVPPIPTNLEPADTAKAHNLQPLLNLLPAETSNNTAETDTDGLCTGEDVIRIPGSSRMAIQRTNLGGDDGEGGEEGQICTSDSGSLDSSSYVSRLPAHAEGLAARYSTSGRPHRKPNRHRRRQRWFQELRNQANIPAGLTDLTSRITDWIPPPPELPLSPKLLDPTIAATYPLPPSRACSEPTPSTQQPPYQLPPYPAVPRSTESSSSSFMCGTRLKEMPRLKASPSPPSSGTTDMTWGPDSPPTFALRLRRAAAISALPPSSPTNAVSSQASSSTRATDVEAELGVLEEAGRKEVIRQHILLWRLIAERGDGGAIEWSRCLGS